MNHHRNHHGNFAGRWDSAMRPLCTPRRPSAAGTPATTTDFAGTVAMPPLCPLCHRRPATCEVHNACDPSRRFWCCDHCFDEMLREDRSWFFWAHRAGLVPRSAAPEFDDDDEDDDIADDEIGDGEAQGPDQSSAGGTDGAGGG